MAMVPPVPCNMPTLFAVRALFDGKADANQQKLAMEWIVFRACATGELAFDIGGEDGRRRTDFDLGRQYAGRSIARLRTPEALAEIEARTKKAAPARREAKNG